MELADLAREFRRLRATPGHMSGAPGQWNAEVDGPGGRKAVVMHELRRRLADGKTGRSAIVALLGDPDEVAHPGDLLWTYARPEGRVADVEALVIYYWRGVHDFLFFEVRGDRVLGAEWWMAGE